MSARGVVSCGWRAVLTVVALLALMVLLMPLVVGCASTKSLSQTEMQARLATVTEAYRMKLAETGNPLMADFLANVPKSGAAGYCNTKRALRNADGSPLVLNGQVQYEGGTAIGLSNSMRDFGAVNKGIFVLGGWMPNWKSGDGAKDAALDGLFLYVEGPGGSSGVDAEFAAIWAGAPAKEKQAAADAVAKALEARKGLLVEGITAAGEVATGVLKEVYRATPVGAASAAVGVLLEKSTGEQVKASVVEPFQSLPESASESESGEPSAAADGG